MVVGCLVVLLIALFIQSTKPLNNKTTILNNNWLILTNASRRTYMASPSQGDKRGSWGSWESSGYTP